MVRRAAERIHSLATAACNQRNSQLAPATSVENDLVLDYSIPRLDCRDGVQLLRSVASRLALRLR